MKRIYLVLTVFLFTALVNANEILVQTQEELKTALKKVSPGDTIILADRIWTDLKIDFISQGTADKPIILKAQTPGNVILNGTSRIIISGKYLTVDGLWFKEGNTIDKSVIVFRKNDDELASSCRVTNCAITDYNPVDRASQYQWIELWGKNNRVDHCTFYGKTNQGPVLIVGLRGNAENLENNHRIDNNYFGYRPPLGSNGGETIRIGTSHSSMESSKTIVENNLFEKCNGEVEIISSKSCDNIYRNNLFLESEGILTLRHGNRCLVEGNVFFGNNKPHTGGIRIINEGHIVQNNLMIGLKGDGFRAPLVIMNGVPNGPVNRYNQVKDVVIQNNTFINCSSIGLCEGSDSERSATPVNTVFANNLFYGTDTIDLLNISDDISEITFSGNKVQGGFQFSTQGFEKINLAWENLESYPIPSLNSDSLLTTKATYRPVRTDLTGTVRTKVRVGAIIPGNKKLPEALSINPGVNWKLEKPSETKTTKTENYKIVKVAPTEDALVNAIKKAKDYTILELTDGTYEVSRGMSITTNLIISGTGSKKTSIKISENVEKSPSYLFKINEGASLVLHGIELDGTSSDALNYAIISQNTPTSKAYKLKLDDIYAHGFTNEGSAIFKAYKGTFADSIQILNSRFEKNSRGLNLSYEKDDLGKYNAEVIDIQNTVFKDIKQFAVYYYRGGNDESTLGGQLNINHCIFYNVDNNEKGRALRTNGIVYINIANSIFAESPLTKYSAALTGNKNSVFNTVVFNAGELKISSSANSKSVLSSNPHWYDTKTFKLKDNSTLKNAATDGKDIGLINQSN